MINFRYRFPELSGQQSLFLVFCSQEPIAAADLPRHGCRLLAKAFQVAEFPGKLHQAPFHWESLSAIYPPGNGSRFEFLSPSFRPDPFMLSGLSICRT